MAFDGFGTFGTAVIVSESISFTALLTVTLSFANVASRSAFHSGALGEVQVPM